MPVDRNPKTPDNASVSVGRALKRLRGEVTQEYVAAVMNVKQPTISRWESEDDPSTPSFEELGRLEDLLGLGRGAIFIAAGLVEVEGVEAAVLADPKLDAEDAQFVLDVYKLRRDRAVHGRKSRK